MYSGVRKVYADGGREMGKNMEGVKDEERKREKN